jgi:hypothetical protein
MADGTFSSERKWRIKKKRPVVQTGLRKLMAGATRLELATFPSSRTGRSHQTRYIVFALAQFDLTLSLQGAGPVSACASE